MFRRLKKILTKLLHGNKRKFIDVHSDERNEFVEVLIQDGYWFLSSAEALFSNPFSMFAGAVLAHHGIELHLKACWIWESSVYSHTHELTAIANLVSFLRSRDRLTQNDLVLVNTFYDFRYPMDDATRNRIQRQLNNTNANIEGIPTLAGELSTFDWERVERLRKFIVARMPNELLKIYEHVVSQFLQ